MKYQKIVFIALFEFKLFNSKAIENMRYSKFVEKGIHHMMYPVHHMMEELKNIYCYGCGVKITPDSVRT